MEKLSRSHKLVNFYVFLFFMLRNAPSTPTLLSVFIINGCYILSNAFNASVDMIVWFLSFLLFMWCITFIDLQILYHPCIPGMNPTWSWHMMFLMYCWTRFANILLRILASMFISNIGLYFLSLLGLYLVWTLEWMILASWKEFGSLHSQTWNSLWRVGVSSSLNVL